MMFWLQLRGKVISILGVRLVMQIGSFINCLGHNPDSRYNNCPWLAEGMLTSTLLDVVAMAAWLTSDATTGYPLLSMGSAKIRHFCEASPVSCMIISQQSYTMSHACCRLANPNPGRLRFDAREPLFRKGLQ